MTSAMPYWPKNDDAVTASGERAWDLYGKLLRDRIVVIATEIDDEVANAVTAQLLFLDSESPEPIRLWISSPGGSVTASLAIFDTMQFLKAPVHTLCQRESAGTAVLLVAAGAKGMRSILPSASLRFVRLQRGPTPMPIRTALAEYERMERTLIDAYAAASKLSTMDVEAMMNIERTLSPAEAVQFGLVDLIVERK